MACRSSLNRWRSSLNRWQSSLNCWRSSLSCWPSIGPSIFEIFRRDDGSAVIEFVILALPLLLPLVIYLGAVHQNSSINNDLHNLARQGARAFITSSNESFEYARLQSVLNIFEARILRPDGIAEVPTLSVECSANPCLTPDARVKVTATLTHSHQRFTGIFRFISTPETQFSASDVQIVDAWR